MHMVKRALRSSPLTDVFFRHMVANMRNGVLAIVAGWRRGTGQRRGLPAVRPAAPARTWPGARSARSCTPTPTSSASSAARFEMATLPNRAELRLKSTDTVIGYTLSLVRDEAGNTVGAALFFKDLTHVEQIEERERLRDRLAAVGEMAAVMAHEIKNPLAAIEVAGRPAAPQGAAERRRADAGEGHHQRGQDGQRHRAGGAGVRAAGAAAGGPHVALRPLSSASAIVSPTARSRAATSWWTMQLPDDLPLLDADQHQLTQVFANLLINAYEALEGPRPHRDIRVAGRAPRRDGALLPDGHQAVDDGRGRRHRRWPGHDAGRGRKDLQPVLHHQGPGFGPRARRSSARSSTRTTAAST